MVVYGVGLMSDFERFKEYGRLREIAKKVDPYSLTFEQDHKLHIALSTGQVIDAEHFHERSDNAVFGWLTTLFLIGMDKRQKSLS